VVDTAPKLPLRDQLIDIERKSAAGNDFRVCQLLICEVRQVNSEDDDDNWGMARPKVAAIQLRARTVEACFSERSRLVGELLECSRHRGSFRSSFLWELGVQGRKWWLSLSCRLVWRPVVEEYIRKAGRWPSDMTFWCFTRGMRMKLEGRGEGDKRAKGSCRRDVETRRDGWSPCWRWCWS
jgi:hypothetical protein